MAGEDQLRVALIGLGWWGRTIVPLLKDNPKLKVVKSMDPAPAAAEFAATHGIAHEASFRAALSGGRATPTPRVRTAAPAPASRAMLRGRMTGSW